MLDEEGIILDERDGKENAGARYAGSDLSFADLATGLGNFIDALAAHLGAVLNQEAGNGHCIRSGDDMIPLAWR